MNVNCDINNGMFSLYPDLLSTEELQKALGIGRTSAYRLINNGAIKHLRIGKNIKIPKQFLIDFVTNSCYNDGSGKSAVKKEVDNQNDGKSL